MSGNYHRDRSCAVSRLSCSWILDMKVVRQAPGVKFNSGKWSERKKKGIGKDDREGIEVLWDGWWDEFSKLKYTIPTNTTSTKWKWASPSWANSEECALIHGDHGQDRIGPILGSSGCWILGILWILHLLSPGVCRSDDTTQHESIIERKGSSSSIRRLR